MSDATGCDSAAEVAPVQPSCTVLRAYTNSNSVTGPDAFTATLSGTPIEVSSVTPSIGPSGGGRQITITGSGFGDPGDDEIVTFGGPGGFPRLEATSVEVEDDGTIVATTPSVPGLDLTDDGTMPSDVIVGTLANGSSDENPPDDSHTFSPWIDSISPGQGPGSGGNTITIAGSGFGAAGSPDTVSLVPRAGGSPVVAASVTVQSDTTITAAVPNAGALFTGGAGSVSTDVTVTTATGATTPIIGNQSEYTFDAAWVDSLAPAAGRLAGGEQVTISGEGFGASGSADTVTFTPQGGGAPEQATDVTVVDDTTITATTPDAGASLSDTTVPVTADVQVTTSGGRTTAVDATDQYTFNPVAVDDISPARGPFSGSNVVVIFGTGFGNPGDDDTVTFVPQGGSAPLTATQTTVINDTTIDAVSPDAAAAMPPPETSSRTCRSRRARAGPARSTRRSTSSASPRSRQVRRWSR